MAALEKMATNFEYQERIAALEEDMRKCPQFELVTNHYFAHGTYTREMHIPADTVVTGKIHRHSCINILTKGKIQVLTDEGEYFLEAPHVFVSGAGVKKAVRTITDVTWINVHPWDGKKDLEQIEHEVIVPSLEQLRIEQQQEALCLGVL